MNQGIEVNKLPNIALIDSSILFGALSRRVTGAEKDRCSLFLKVMIDSNRKILIAAPMIGFCNQVKIQANKPIDFIFPEPSELGVSPYPAPRPPSFPRKRESRGRHSRKTSLHSDLTFGLGFGWRYDSFSSGTWITELSWVRLSMN